VLIHRTLSNYYFQSARYFTIQAVILLQTLLVIADYFVDVTAVSARKGLERYVSLVCWYFDLRDDLARRRCGGGFVLLFVACLTGRAVCTVEAVSW